MTTLSTELRRLRQRVKELEAAEQITQKELDGYRSGIEILSEAIRKQGCCQDEHIPY